MINFLQKVTLLLVTCSSLLGTSILKASDSDSAVISNIYHEALTNGQSYGWLEKLCKDIGPRMSGTPQAAQAVTWGKKLMEDLGFDRVYLQEVMVPHWERGDKEQAQVYSRSVPKGKMQMHICALGGSVATPVKGIKAEIIEVQDFEELKKLGKDKIKGKIVFFNRPMDPALVNAFNAYSGAGNQRVIGGMRASGYGAVAAIVRSLTLKKDHVPHTGSMYFPDTVNKIPCAAISTADADYLSEVLKKDAHAQFFIKMNCRKLPEEKSYNVIGEMTGSQYPNEIITIGGHLDSWDLGVGASDDGAGCVQSIEVLRMFKALGIRPKRTVRAVLFMNEEFGMRGAFKYFDEARADRNNKYIVAMESDRGGFTPRGFSIDTGGAALKHIQSWKHLLAGYGLHDFEEGGSGDDVYLLKQTGTVCIDFAPDSQRYFDYHHSDNDQFENVNRRELELGGAAMASLIYLFAEYGVK